MSNDELKEIFIEEEYEVADEIDETFSEQVDTEDDCVEEVAIEMLRVKYGPFLRTNTFINAKKQAPINDDEDWN